MIQRIAITGGIGSGKSCALRFFAGRGEKTYSCDEIYREMMDEPAYVEKIAQAFPDCVRAGKIDKKALAAFVFSDERARERLNQIAHPTIMRRLREKMDECANTRVFVEIPLLFENGYEGEFDFVVVLLREREKRIADLLQRDGCTKAEIEARMQAQFSYDEQALQSRLQTIPHAYVKNDGGVQELEEELNRLMKHFS